ncbi:Endonuclease/exonuclease/phosphatase superfamily [Arabidopsis thaliana x Arabidopsis arenosa]|uniref:Endonuclease/exonuclease/phosphatase superfamily n=1 Tax=Arabidopsis thaliana x Arabidopsis arenosa TaxID=1240361 RepID=A0A8T2AT45_9BRAS|nr:Endonuclease/exonuclease/phosphatase superfamily [Arabidopsis thaliana x Arabidopsis arenosa]
MSTMSPSASDLPSSDPPVSTSSLEPPSIVGSATPLSQIQAPGSPSVVEPLVVPSQAQDLGNSAGSAIISQAPIDSTISKDSVETPPIIDDIQLQWAARFNPSLRNLSKAAQPTLSEDGTPKVRAPASVILKASDTWKDHIVAHFHGSPPPAGKIFVDLNPIWGKDGRINIRCLPNGLVLIFIPSEATRKWVLEVGCWQAGNCLFSVTAWSPTATLTPLKLVSLPIWVILKDVPPQLYSLPGLSTIASGIGEPLHTEKYQLPPLAMDTRIKVEILLKKVLPQSVLVTDDDGNEVRIWVEYPRLPPKCDYCKEFGHLYHRCPTAPDISNTTSQPSNHVTTRTKDNSTLCSAKQVALRSISGQRDQPPPRYAEVVLQTLPVHSVAASGTPPPNVPSKTDFSKSNHRYFTSPTSESSNEWQVVKNKSKPHVNKALVKEVEPNQGGSSVTAAQFAEEEEAIQIGQRIIRRRSSSPQRPPTILPDQSNKPLTSITSQPSAGIISTSKEVSVAKVAKKPPSKSGKSSQSSQSRQLKSWVSSSRPSIGAILETHVQNDNAAAILARIFPGWRHEFNYLPTASNGRIWLVWNPAVKVFIYKKTDQLISCGVFDPSTCESFSVTFVYARNCLIARRDLWVALEELHNHSLQRNHPWLILGDFNQILIAEDHYSLLPYTLPLQGMNEFQSCIDTCELLHLSSRGAEHTWYNGQPSNPITRKLDRALINESWLMAFPQSSMFVDAPGGSDHCPLLISISDSVQRRKVPFKFYSFFTTHPDFPSIVESAWNLDLAHTSTMFSLCHRLKAVKLGCKALNRTSFSNIQARSAEAHDMLTSIQNQLLTSPSTAQFEEEKEQRRRWSFFAAAEESFLMQKSRIRWCDEGDSNTSFFHKSVMAHQVRNSITYLKNDADMRITDKILLKQLVVDYYQNLLGTRNTSVLPLPVERIRELNSFRCTATLATQLTSIPTPEEVTSTVFSLPRNKAPGPDGFTVDFFINSWSVVGPSLIAAVVDFFKTGKLLKQVNATILALIPKTDSADRLGEFRPISCCNTIYKVISRLLAKRLKLFMDLAVQRNQVAFIKGRLLCENVLLASELVADFNTPGPVSRGCLQIDISKAFDNIDWGFLTNILVALDLPTMFINWLTECFTTPSFSVALNGELIGYFPGKKGLRQGDSISAPLFALVMDTLSKQLDLATTSGRIQAHHLCVNPLVTHLSFADDILVFFNGQEASLIAILDVLAQFKSVSGLGINLSKSCLFLDGSNFDLISQISSRHNLTHGSLPIRYLGVPLLPSKLNASDYQPLIDRIKGRISSWTNRHLSFAGRLQLLHSVINSTINFWASIFILPNKCIAELEQLCSAFLWKGAASSARGAKVSWEVVCSPKSAGGLGLKRLADWNQIFGLKLIWLLFSQAGSLWVSWVKNHLIRGRCFWDADFRFTGSWIWRRLSKLRVLARPFIFCSVQSGCLALFWHDNWTNLGPLIDIVGPAGPRVTGIGLLATVSEAVVNDAWFLPRGRHPLVQLLRNCLLSHPPPLETETRKVLFLWKIDADQAQGHFSSSKTWKHLHPPGPTKAWFTQVWFKERIPKLAFMFWLTVQDRLTTRDRLRRWNLPIPAACLLCQTDEESRDHLFFQCTYSNTIWQELFGRFSPSPSTQFGLLLNWIKKPTTNRKLNSICKLVLQALVYNIWKERNARLHSVSPRSTTQLKREIQLLLRRRLAGLDRAATATGRPSSTTQAQETYLSLWFGNFQ